MPPFSPGQRWLSTTEPELGLGTILKIEGRNVLVLFATAAVTRQYAATSAPLVRAAFKPGDRINVDGQTHLVTAVTEADGLLRYAVDGAEIVEARLDDVQPSGSAGDRLVACRVDPPAAFDLRVEALDRRARARAGAAHGVLAARIDLIPHQLRVAQLLAERRHPRALLADEVGLGKTIEACLAIARLIASGRARRVLVLVPEALVYQWFVELKRRFNLDFAIFDEERVEAIELAADGRNPFEDEQLVITDWSFLVGAPERARAALKAGWDLLVVDEAHHLAWSPESESPEYVLVEALARRTPGVLLLTATPEQLGRSGHFARLRLLDPDRFHDLDAFQDETRGYVALSAVVEALEAGHPLDPAQAALLRQVLADDPDAAALVAADPGDAAARHRLLASLVDRHGTGRVMFRNRRALVGGFPRRLPGLAVLPPAEGALASALLEEFHGDLADPAAFPPLDYARDPRLAWLVGLLDAHPREKFLVICRSQAKLHALDEALTHRSGVAVARFHEGLGIVQRDRAAAHFADPAGARVLLASEIGSEGRNFQFAQHLVLWDLPLDPDQVEQRIGRLDRIGQRGDVHIHACAVDGSAQHAVLRWYDEGLDAFRASPEDGREIMKRHGGALVAVADALARGEDGAAERLDALIADTRADHATLSAEIAAGRDRLLELATRLAPDADAMLDALAQADADPAIEPFVVRLLEHHGVEVEELDPGLVLLDPEMVRSSALPGLDEPRRATFRRPLALAREDVLFLKPDHPLVDAALDQLLESDTGTAALALDDTLPLRTALLEAVYVLECVVPPALAIDRFLPATPIRVRVDTRLEERDDLTPDADAIARLAERGIDPTRFRRMLAQLVPPMLGAAERVARDRADALAAAATAQADARLGAEVERLLALARVNPSVRTAEIDAARREREAIAAALPQARLRLAAVRFVASADLAGIRR
jgi:ATP-dependent helicase HepA